MKSFGLLIFLGNIALTSIYLVGALPITNIPYRIDYEDDGLGKRINPLRYGNYEDDGLVKRSRPLRYTSPEYDDPEEPAEASKKRFSQLHNSAENAKRAVDSI
ncbi:hypothetical protein B0H11DRAFT_1914302 [Mycena galericulata]|nr:hypothetical protein B0H11DRAFT_1914302 [Mycena galericulata]